MLLILGCQELGTLAITLHSAKDLYVEVKTTPLNFQRVDYRRIGAHMEDKGQGFVITWNTITRADQYKGPREKTPSWNAQKKIREILINTINAWAQTAPDQLAEAEKESMTGDIARLEEKISEHETDIKKLRSEISKLKQAAVVLPKEIKCSLRAPTFTEEKLD